MFCFRCSSGKKILISYVQTSIENNEIIKMIIPPITVIHGKNQLIMKMSVIADAKTITSRNIFVYHTLIYHSIKSFSS